MSDVNEFKFHFPLSVIGKNEAEEHMKLCYEAQLIYFPFILYFLLVLIYEPNSMAKGPKVLFINAKYYHYHYFISLPIVYKRSMKL